MDIGPRYSGSAFMGPGSIQVNRESAGRFGASTVCSSAHRNFIVSSRLSEKHSSGKANRSTQANS